MTTVVQPLCPLELFRGTGFSARRFGQNAERAEKPPLADE